MIRMIFISIVLCLLFTRFAWAENNIDQATSNVVNDINNTVKINISLLQMGRSGGVELGKGQYQAGLSFTLPEDKVVTNAMLNLNLQVSSSLAERDIDLKLKLNGQALGNVPLKASSSINTYKIKIPAVLVTSNNHLSFEVDDGGELLCRSAHTNTYQVTILPTTTIDIVAQQLNVSADLYHFPKPFFDVKQMNASDISVSFPEKFTTGQVSAAAFLSSWFGIESDYRDVSFNVLNNTLPKGNGIVIGKPGQVVGGLKLPNNNDGILKIIPNPSAPIYKLLLITGKNDQKLRSAVWQLINSNFQPETSEIVVTPQVFPQSELYDAPRWISTKRPVYLNELIRQDQSMSVDGISHDALHVSFRAAPDLFLWDGDNVPMRISYRFPSESWIDQKNSFLNLTFNNKFLDDLPMNKQGGLERLWQKLGGDIRQERVEIPIDPKMIYGDNQLSLYFKIASSSSLPCNDLQSSNIQSQIKEDSWIDLSDTRHFTLLPNLSYFASSSFPFSRMADYSETTILLPQKPSNTHIATLLDMAARSGNDTGTPLIYNRVLFGLPSNHTEYFESKDILAISTMDQTEFNQQLLTQSPYEAINKTLSIRKATTLQSAIRLFKGSWDLNGVEAERYISSKQSWRGFISYRSPWNDQRVVVLALASDDQQLERLNTDLNSINIASKIQGDVSIITDENGVRSFQVAPQFPSGELPWYLLIIWYANQHSLILGCLSGFICLIGGGAIFNVLQRRIKQRLNSE